MGGGSLMLILCIGVLESGDFAVLIFQIDFKPGMLWAAKNTIGFLPSAKEIFEYRIPLFDFEKGRISNHFVSTRDSRALRVPSSLYAPRHPAKDPSPSMPPPCFAVDGCVESFYGTARCQAMVDSNRA